MVARKSEPVMGLPKAVLADAAILCEASRHTGARPCGLCVRTAVYLSGSGLRLARERHSRNAVAYVPVVLGDHL